jgi:malonyl CoA-acyl carrier protein transacylase
MGVTRVVELGPGAVLTGMVKRIAPDLGRASIGTPEEVGASAAGGG